MKNETYVDNIRTHSEAIRKIVYETPPDAPVPTCSEWTVTGLVGHLGRIHDAALKSIDADPNGTWPGFVEPPADWDAARDWWEERSGEFLDRLPGLDPEAPAWVFSPAVERKTGFWIRVIAHEMALHRLDAEYTSQGLDTPELLSFGYQPAFAADGVTEFLTAMIPSFVSHREPIAVTATARFEALDVGRVWRMDLRPEEIPVITEGEADFFADVTISGTAEGVYRALWGRPTTAERSGDVTLLHGVRAP